MRKPQAPLVQQRLSCSWSVVQGESDRVDVFTPAKRTVVMSHIRSGGTRPELFVRKLIFAPGFRYRLHDGGLPGKPDIVLPKYHAVIFVNGCFWHHHEGCRLAARPATRSDFWERKLAGNKRRDEDNIRALLSAGWRVLVIWECACLKRFSADLSSRVCRFLREQDVPRAEIGRNDLEGGAHGHHLT